VYLCILIHCTSGFLAIIIFIYLYIYTHFWNYCTALNGLALFDILHVVLNLIIKKFRINLNMYMNFKTIFNININVKKM